MKRMIAMVFGLCFASMWLGCGMGEDEAWSDEDGVVPADRWVPTNDEAEGLPPDEEGPAIDEPIPDPITRPDVVEEMLQREGW